MASSLSNLVWHLQGGWFPRVKAGATHSRDIGLEFSECRFCILLISASHKPDQFTGWVHKHCILMRKRAFAPDIEGILGSQLWRQSTAAFQEGNWYAKHHSWENAKTPPSSTEKNLKVSNPEMDSLQEFLLLRGGGDLSIRVKVKVKRAG